MAYHRPPSRIKYEQNHPNVTVRLSQDLKKYLDSVRAATGKSYPILVREGLESDVLTRLLGKPILDLSQEEITVFIGNLETILVELNRRQVKTG